MYYKWRLSNETILTHITSIVANIFLCFCNIKIPNLQVEITNKNSQEVLSYTNECNNWSSKGCQVLMINGLISWVSKRGRISTQDWNKIIFYSSQILINLWQTLKYTIIEIQLDKFLKKKNENKVITRNRWQEILDKI